MQYKNDESVKNISYINKDFPAIWQELLELIPKLTNKWNPAEANESDPLAVLIKLLAIYTDKLNFNIDKNILEAFPSSLTQLRSAYNVYDTVGYNPSWYRSAITKLQVTYNLPVPNSGNTYMLPRLTRVCDEDGEIIYTTLQDTTFNTGSITPGFSLDTVMIQGNINDYIINGVKLITLTNLDEDNKIYFTENNVADNGVFVSSTEEFDAYSSERGTLLGDWVRVDNIYQVGVNEKAFKFGVDPVSGACYIQFPETISNLIGSGIYIKYTLSQGYEGNIKSNTISRFYDENTVLINVNDAEDSIKASNYIILNNLEATSNGADPETIDEMYKNYQKVKNVFDTLVTLLDYENYLYRYTYTDGSRIVSNILATDRTNDLYESYDVQTLDRWEGNKLIHTITQDNGADTISAYDIRFYPLSYTSSVNTDKLFLGTFESFSTPSERTSWYARLNDAIEDAKIINHNQLAPGRSILVDYDIAADIYLNEKVTSQVASQILNKVKAALREKLNAHEVNYGELVPYTDVLSTIQSADSHIDYVALQPIQYTSEVNISSSSVDGSSTLNNSTAIARNILAGTLPWTEVEEGFTYNAAQANGSIANYTSPLNISSYLEITNNTSDATIFKLAKNEVLSLLSPAYQEEITYANYLYYYYTGNTVIKPDTLTALTGDIYFFDTRDSINPGGAGASYILHSGDIIQANFELDPDIEKSGSLNKGKSITKLNKISGTLSTSGNLIQFFTNSVPLLQQLAGATETIDYTLTLSEYFLFREISASGYSTSFTLLGEGTTLIFNNINRIFRDDAYQNYVSTIKDISIDWEGIQAGESSATAAFNNLWLPNTLYTRINNIDGAAVTYQVNEIMTFNEGYSFTYLDESNNSISFLDSTAGGDWFVNDLSNSARLFNATTPLSNYNLFYKDTTSNASSEDWMALKTLPSVDDNWRGLLRVDIDTTDDASQQLVVANTPGELAHLQKLQIDPSGGPAHIYEPSGDVPLFIQTSPEIATSGVNMEINSDDTLLTVRTYAIDSELVSDSNFTTIESGKWTASVIPTGYCAIISVFVDTTEPITVSTAQTTIGDAPLQKIFFICLDSSSEYVEVKKTGSDPEELVEFAIGPMVLVNENNTFGVQRYLDNTSAPTISTLVDTILNDTELGAGDIFNYIYTPDKSSEIDLVNPLSGESYLNKNNVLNRYSIPRLNSLDMLTKRVKNAPLFSNIKISNLSIR